MHMLVGSVFQYRKGQRGEQSACTLYICHYAYITNIFIAIHSSNRLV